MENITRFLTTKLKLKVNQTKSAVAPPKNRKFLGFSFTGGKQPRRRIAPKAILRFQTRIRELTCRTRGISMEQRAKELSAYLRGWRGYCGFCQTPRSCIALIRGSGVDCGRRSGNSGNVGAHALPSFAKGGIGRDLAAQTAGSSHGPWRLANRPALKVALSNAFFGSLGIPHLSGLH
jgi:RNA-directed DNA polymerase